MKRRLVLSLLTLWLPAAMAADHRHIAPVRPKVEYHGVAVVHRVEPILGLLNLTHGEVAYAGWATHTRDLRVKPRELVQGLYPGMKIRFQLTAVDPMTYVITALEPVE